MRLRLQDLERQLARGLAPVYLVSGDEPLQLGEAADAVRAAARQAGHSTRELFEAGSAFDWNQLRTEANSLSLFADKKLIDLRIPGGKPGKEGGATLVDYCTAPPPDTLLLLTLPKLERAQLNAKWFKAVDEVGAVVQVWPIEGPQLVRWIEQRLRRAGLRAEQQVAALLAERVEGNLLAASQEIEKLLLLHGPGEVGAQALAAAVADSARYDVFSLIDSALQGDAARCVRILGGLRGEGVAPPVVLWALSRELRALLPLAQDVARGRSPDQAMTRARVWDKRKPLLRAALGRLRPVELRRLLGQCQGIDAVVKGVQRDDPWRWLEQLTLQLAGTRALTLPG
jgi:DNA polymerase-3 subunit delta